MSKQGGGGVKIERDGRSSAAAIPWWELLGAGVKMNRIERTRREEE